MTIDEIHESISEANPDALLADGFDDALIGYVERAGSQPVACYSRKKCIEVLMQQGMAEDSANEYFDFNVVGAYVGESTPVFLTDLTQPQL